MKNFVKVHSTWKYYTYLTKYEPKFVRKYQLGENYYLGQRSLWKNLVFKMSGDHINLEEEHNFKYKTHMAFVNFSYRGAWFLTFYMLFYILFFLHEPGRIFNTAEFDYPINPSGSEEYPTRYERFYLVDRKQKY